jgi:ribose transport system permease protein
MNQIFGKVVSWVGGAGPGADASSDPGVGAARRKRALLAGVSPRNIGAIYVLVIICIIFSIESSASFDQSSTIPLILNDSAITAMAALAILVPLSARVFDLSFAYTMSLAGVTTAQILVDTHLGLVVAILLGIGASLVVGAINCIVVVAMKIDSFIGTLATGSLVLAFITFVTNGATVNGSQLSGTFANLYSVEVGGIILPVYYALVIAVILWLVLEHTATGRRLYAVGFNPDAARLANIPVTRLRVGALLTSSLVAGIAGIVLASSTSSAATDAGTPYLLSAYATAFLGATQLKAGRFNAIGTLIAVLMLETGITGLGLVGAPPWAADMFTGVMLIAALSATGLQRRVRRGDTTTFGRAHAKDAPPGDQSLPGVPSNPGPGANQMTG